MVSWLKNGQPLDTKRVHIRSTERDSILFIRTAERDDSGEYEMCVKVDDFDDKAALVLQIVGEGNVRVASEERPLAPSSLICARSFRRAARASCQREDCGHLGLQRRSGVDPTDRRRKRRHHGLHGPEGGQKDWSECGVLKVAKS